MKSPLCNPWILFPTKSKLINFFAFKDKIPAFLCSGTVYKSKCGGCNATSYGKTRCHFKVNVRTLRSFCSYWKNSWGENDSVIKAYNSFCNYWSGFENFSISASNSNEFKITLRESLFINRDHSPLNKTTSRYHWIFLLTEEHHMIATDWSDCNPLVLLKCSSIKWIVLHS